MQIEVLTTGNTIIDFIIGAFALFGGGKFAQMIYERWTKKKDEQVAVHATNEAKIIDADVSALQLLYKRVENLEKEQGEIRKELSQEMAKSAKLEAENDALRKDNERLEKEIDRQRDNVHKLRNEIQNRDGEIASFKQSLKDRDAKFLALSNEMNQQTSQLNELKRKVAEMDLPHTSNG